MNILNRKLCSELKQTDQRFLLSTQAMHVTKSIVRDESIEKALNWSNVQSSLTAIEHP